MNAHQYKRNQASDSRAKKLLTEKQKS